MFSSLKKSDKGFTLVELMVVVLIIGILVAIAIPIFNNASKQAKIKTCQANIRTINGALAQKAATDGVELTALTITDPADLSPDYLKSEPVCNFTGSPVAYTIASGDVVATAHNHN